METARFWSYVDAAEMDTAAQQQVSCAELLDGARVVLRRLRPRDADQVVRLYETLTDEECYFRFFALHPVHLREWARSLTEPAADRYALGAFEADVLLGVANYVEDPSHGCTEVAVVVDHNQHLRGVGTVLLQRLGQIAKEHGVHRFVAEVLALNRPLLEMIADSGWPCTRRLDSSVIHIDIDLDAVN
ncbi:hypothetical protein MTY414_17350 [Mycolicibacterium mageritense]|nr:hypothetical protein MTY414_17350 [Mycolicibacterium mageritense]